MTIPNKDIKQVIQEDKDYNKPKKPYGLDLDVGSPDDVVNVLREAAGQYYDSATELSASWQDKNAGKIWIFIADQFGKLADKIEAKIK